MSETQPEILSLTAPAVCTFPNLDEPRAVKGSNGKESGEPKYSSNFEFEPTSEDFQAIKAMAVKVARAKWPGRSIGKEAADKDENGNAKMPTFGFPWTNGDKLADKAKAKGKDREFSRGKVVLTSRSKFQPVLSVIDGGRIKELEGTDLAPNNVKRLFYTGVGVLAEFNFVAYDGVGNNPDGVTAYLNKVCSTNKGKKLVSAGKSSAETFKGYVGTASNEDPTGAELDDEIPF